MKKLIFIVIAAISLISVSNALGQERRASSKTKTVKGTPWVIAADHGLSVKNGKSRGTTSSQRSSRTRKPVPKSYKLLFFSENPAIKTSSGSTATDSSSRRAKQPRKGSTQKRQYKPLY